MGIGDSSRGKGSQPGWWQVVGSVLASFAGVQSRSNRERDFSHGDPRRFVVIGLLMTALFVLLVWGAVQLALHQAGVPG